MEQFRVRIDSLQRSITALQVTDIQQFPFIFGELVALTHDVMYVDNDTLKDEIDDMLTNLINKIDTFITPPLGQ